MNYDKCGALLKNYKTFEIAKYIRLSLADEINSNDESESVVNQRRLINDFIFKNGNIGDRCREFIDDGVSGTNFDRPGWKELQDAMESGEIKVVITKSLSRLGRSNFECSYYLDCYFPDNNIRYIAIQEQIDTGNLENSNNEYAALNNFINEKYSRDLSRNIRKVYKIKQYAGEYMGSCALFGYVKDPNDKHKLIVDEDSSKIVKKIFDLYLKLQSQSAVMKILSEEKIPIPEVYKKTRRGLKVKFPYEWNYHTIRSILRNRMYIGDMVQNVHSKKSFREKKIVKTDKNDWIIVEGTHEPIIDKDIFNRVQILLDANYRQPILHQRCFKGIMFCYECGHRIGIGNPKKDNRLFYTYCNFYRKNSAYNKCSSHSMNYNNLEMQLFNIIFDLYKKYLNLIDYKDIIERRKKDFFSYVNTLEKNIEKLKIDIKSIDLKNEKIYMDKLDGIISQDIYIKMNSNLICQKEKKQNEINVLKHSIELYHKNKISNNLFDANFIINKYLETRKILSRDLILKIVDRIEIHKDKTVDLYLNLMKVE